MTILSTYDYSSDSNGTQIVGGGSWSVNKTGTATILGKSDAVRTGQLGMECTSATSSTCRLSYTETTTSTRVIAFEFSLPSTISVATFFQGAIDASNIGDSRVNVGQAVAIRNVNTVISGTGDTSPNGTSTSTLSNTHRYRWERMYNHGAGTTEARVYDSEGATPDTPIITLGGGASSLTATQHTRIDVGIPAAAAGMVIRFGKVIVADTWVGDAAFSGGSAGTVNATTATATATAPAPTIPPVVLNLPTPAYIHHRAMIPGPESTIDSYSQHMTVSATSLVDVDLQLLQNGAVTTDMAVFHNTTIDGLTSPDSPASTGEVDTDFSLTQWQALRFGTSSPGHAPATATAMVSMFGPSGTVDPGHIMCWEVKTTSAYAASLNIIDTLGVRPQVMMQSFSSTAAYEMAARGYATAFIAGGNDPGTGGSPTCATLAANGVQYLFLNKANISATPSIVTDAHAAGLKIFPADDINTTTERDTYLALGVDGIVTGRPDLLNPNPPVTAAVATGSAAAPAPTIQAGATVTAAVATASSDGQAPTLQAGAQADATAATATGDAPAPTVTAGPLISPPAATGTGDAQTPTIAAGAQVDAATATGTADAQVPTVSAGATGTVDATTATGTGAAQTPAVQAGATITAATATASGQALAPTTSTGATTTPAERIATIRPRSRIHVVKAQPRVATPRPARRTINA